jgi:ribosomal protein S30
MDWRCGSSTKAPALRERRPKFKPKSHKKIFKKRSLATREFIYKEVHYTSIKFYSFIVKRQK